MLELNFSPFPILTTERLTLRNLNQEDAERILQLRSDESVNKYLDRPKARTLDEARSFITKINAAISQNQTLYWGICFKNELEILGTVCLWNISLEKQTVEIGYELLPSMQGQGIMQEALPAVIRFAFDRMQISMIEAVLHRDNIRSINLLLKNYFSLNEMGENSIIEKDNIVTYTLTPGKGEITR
jgi:ribosomal-protein-alanine N-acetyltransferase